MPFVSLIKRPLLDALRPDQPRMLQNLHMFAGRGLAHAHLPRDKNPADSIRDEIAVHLRRKVFSRALKPCEDLQPSCAGESAQCQLKIHIDT